MQNEFMDNNFQKNKIKAFWMIITITMKQNPTLITRLDYIDFTFNGIHHIYQNVKWGVPPIPFEQQALGAKL